MNEETDMEMVDRQIADAVEHFMDYAVEKELSPEVFTYVLSHTLCETVLSCYQDPDAVLDTMFGNMRTIMDLMMEGTETEPEE